VEQGILTVQATAIPAQQRFPSWFAKLLVDGIVVGNLELLQQRSPSWFAKLLGLLGHKTEGQTWVLPNGQAAEQTGPRQTDLLLVWSDDDANPLDETCIQEHWPQCRQVQQLGKNLFLLRGVEPQGAANELAHGQAPGKVCPVARPLHAPKGLQQTNPGQSLGCAEAKPWVYGDNGLGGLFAR